MDTIELLASKVLVRTINAAIDSRHSATDFHREKMNFSLKSISQQSLLKVSARVARDLFLI